MPKFGTVKDRAQLGLFDEPAPPKPVYYQEPAYVERTPLTASDLRVVDAVQVLDTAYLAYVSAINFNAAPEVIAALKSAYDDLWNNTQNVLVNEWQFKIPSIVCTL